MGRIHGRQIRSNPRHSAAGRSTKHHKDLDHKTDMDGSVGRAKEPHRRSI